MDDNELTIYILQQLRQGVPEQSIRAILAQNGWPQPLVDRAFSMVQQARPHSVDPQLPTEPLLAVPQESELPAPADNPYPVLEREKKRENQNRLRRLLMTLLALLVLAAIGGAIYYFAIKDKPEAKKAANTPIAQTNVDDERREAVNRLTTKLEDYYKSRGTYPTLTHINSSEFAHSSAGFDASKYTDPEWDAKKSACANTEAKPILAETRSDGCITYRATASNGGDCDASAALCTRIVITTTLKDKKPYIVALDRNNRE